MHPEDNLYIKLAVFKTWTSMSVISESRLMVHDGRVGKIREQKHASPGSRTSFFFRQMAGILPFHLRLNSSSSNIETKGEKIEKCEKKN